MTLGLCLYTGRISVKTQKINIPHLPSLYVCKCAYVSVNKLFNIITED